MDKKLKIKKRVRRVVKFLLIIVLVVIVHTGTKDLLIGWGLREDGFVVMLAILPALYVGYIVWHTNFNEIAEKNAN